MNPNLKKFLITAGLSALVVLIAGVVFSSGGKKTPEPAPAAQGGAPETSAASAPVAASASTEGAPAGQASDAAATATPTATQAAAPAGSAQSFSARVPAGLSAVTAPKPIGSLDPAVAPLEIAFAQSAAGIESIRFADYWKSVDAARDARRVREGKSTAMPADSERYTLVSAGELQGYALPVLAARAVEIDGTLVSLFGAKWAELAPGVFATEIVDAADRPVLRITRTFTAPGADPSNAYLMRLEHRVENLDGAAHKLRLVQYGPGDLGSDATREKGLTDVRRFHFGYLYPPERDPSRSFVTANGQMFDHATVVSNIGEGDVSMWPNRVSKEGAYSLVWYGSTDRYFALAVHSDYRAGTATSRELASVVEVRAILGGDPATGATLFSELWSPALEVAPASQAALSMGVYAGPLDPKILGGIEPYAALNMPDLIVYLMSGCCSWCTFAWLADGLLWFLTFLHDYVVFDWGVAIIALVVVVRTILHPVQKKSQISMQRFSRAMSALKPELDALQKKFKDEPQRMQQEQMRLFREKGVSPAGCVGGLLPTFAQMPIWMALYAVLYFAFELRHSAPFFGVFQAFGDWSFLADLSQPDNFIRFETPLNLFLFTLSSINLLPIMMAFVFWLQQKYMAPPTMPNMSEDQLAQQKMMKWMMVIMFPLMTYIVPSGLTLYILTSTCIGIIESRMIKKQVDAMDLSAPAAAPAKAKKKDFLGRMYEQALARAQDREKQRKNFKQR